MAALVFNIFSNFMSATCKVSRDHSLRQRTSGSGVTLRGAGGQGVPKSAGRAGGRGRLERGPWETCGIKVGPSCQCCPLTGCCGTDQQERKQMCFWSPGTGAGGGGGLSGTQQRHLEKPTKVFPGAQKRTTLWSNNSFFFFFFLYRNIFTPLSVSNHFQRHYFGGRRRETLGGMIKAFMELFICVNSKTAET